MKNNSLCQLCLIFCGALLSASNALSHEQDRLSQLQIANDELVMRLSEVINANQRLKKRLTSQCGSARSKCHAVTENRCSPELIFDQFMGYSRNDRDDFLKPWLKRYGLKCSSDELHYIETVLVPEMTFTSAALVLLKKLRADR
tara:strand:- start:86 stop:517 length:432 start_codon:yes stop_codon:yes gene_type:complete